MAKVERLSRLMNVLDQRRREARRAGKLKVVVGYTAEYAIYVHENLQAHHPVGQAKFLEQPMRTHAGEIRRVTTRALKSGTPLASAMALGGIHLMRLSQQLVPVDTGFLKQSAFTRVEGSGGVGTMIRG